MPRHDQQGIDICSRAVDSQAVGSKGEDLASTAAQRGQRVTEQMVQICRRTPDEPSLVKGRG